MDNGDVERKSGIPLLTDTHCHLDRYRSPSEVLARALASGVRVLAVTSRPSHFRTLFPLFGRRSGVRLALGLHPLEAGRMDLRRELALFAGYADHTSYIGEIGLDGSPQGRASRALQEEALDAVLATPGVTDKVLSVHSRGAAADTVRRLADAKSRRVILHWYSGSFTDLDTALAAGFHFSINPSMARSKKGQAVIARLPHDRVLLETDGPYARLGGRQLEPRDARLALNHLARAWDAPPVDVATRVATNLTTLCRGLAE